MCLSRLQDHFSIKLNIHNVNVLKIILKTRGNHFTDKRGKFQMSFINVREKYILITYIPVYD